MSLRSDYEARWYNPLTAAVVLTLDIMADHGSKLRQASRAAATVFAVAPAEVEEIIRNTMADAMKILRGGEAEQPPPPLPRLSGRQSAARPKRVERET